MSFIFASIQDPSFRNDLEVYVLCAMESNLSFCRALDQIYDAINIICGNIMLTTWYFVYSVFQSIFQTFKKLQVVFITVTYVCF